MPESDSFKEWFNADRYHSIANALAKACRTFDKKMFLQMTLNGLKKRELMTRLRQTSIAAAASVPGDYPQQLKVIRKIAGPEANGMIGDWYSDFVGQFGVNYPELSLPALSYFTQFGSAEFAIREFLIRSPKQTLKVMLQWSKDDDEHVRRLASEGSRPRLPWGKRLGLLVIDPKPTRRILENLRNDESLYVRKSVANHLNDIAKDHPDYVMDLVESWDQGQPHVSWITRHGLRTLIKKAHPQTLKFLGVGDPPKLAQLDFAVSPGRIKLGERIELRLSITSASRTPQTLLIVYVIHYVKANGSTSAKVFKWKQIMLAAGSSLSLLKRQTIRGFSTRKHYPGLHPVEIQINGRRLTADAFQLRL